jgi:3-deoxy-7-phosphoheptulonate synthase
VAKGKHFIIQGGDCAETFRDFSDEMIKNKLKIILQMSAIIKYTTSLETINIGRIAGQYIKPRTNDIETRDGVSLPAYRGDGVNSILFDHEKRIPNPKRLVKAYHQSAATMNLIKSLIISGFTDIQQIELWSRDLLDQSPLGEKYKDIVKKITEILQFARGSGIIANPVDHLNKPMNFYTSHEVLLLDYERAFLINDNKNKVYCCSTHMLWVGDRTRFADSEHIEFVSSIDNPIGIKIGPTVNIDDLCRIYDKINPDHKEGRIVFITRLGEKNIETILPQLIDKVKKYGQKVIWLCDPMHGNTIKAKNGYKTRSFDTIIHELNMFFEIHNTEQTIPGGVHFELTGENVTECLGGINNIQDEDLDHKYETTCDPRLNNEQSLEIAFLISELLKNKGKKIEKIKY